MKCNHYQETIEQYRSGIVKIRTLTRQKRELIDEVKYLLAAFNLSIPHNKCLTRRSRSLLDKIKYEDSRMYDECKRVNITPIENIMSGRDPNENKHEELR